ncbi:calponin, partial [Teratosphaeriaceae sp. CCFEE 6253]
MASVSSLDQDMRNLRLSRYTPQAAQEVRTWIEETLNERLPPGDLLLALKDGVALCKLATLALGPPGVRGKVSNMPFIQMENISHFLKACEMAPLNLQAHDRFLTVDLFESKDPAQVLQCLGAFSRQAHTANPSRFRTTIGPRKAGGVVSPTNTSSNGTSAGFRPSAYARPASPVKPAASRALSPSLTGGSTGSQGSAKSPGPTSSWSQRKDEGTKSPAWNIHQYGYMGGASQGNQGISFGARRQITSLAPAVPSLGDKERKRKERVDEEARVRRAGEVEEERVRGEREAGEQRERVDEERRWEVETRRQREEERRRVEEQKRMWAAQERRWSEEEEVRRREAAEVQKRLLPKKPPERPRVSSASVLRGQSLAQYQREQAASSATSQSSAGSSADETPEQKRVKELEQQLEEARERERQYQAEREERLRNGGERSRPSTAQTETPRPPSARESEASWAGDEREDLRQ